MRIIFHIDMNAFYAAVEQAEHPELRGQPVAVAGDPEKRNGVILTASYEARKFGVRSACAIWQAKALCPGIILIRPHYDLYHQYSTAVIRILQHHTPLVEQFSIDEAWADVIGSHLVYGGPMELACRIQDRIREELNLTCSIGIGPNKLLSKMASDLKKPNGITLITEENIPTRIWPLPVKDLIFVGPKTAEKLNNLGILTIGDLAGTPIAFLRRMFGRIGIYLYYFANGMDASPVRPGGLDQIKGVGHSITTPRDMKTFQEVQGVLLGLSEWVSTRLRQQKLAGKVIQVGIKDTAFESILRQRPLPCHSNLTEDIYPAACRLFRDNWDWQKKVRLLALRVTDLCKAEFFLQEDFFSGPVHEKQQNLSRSLDNIRERFGFHSVLRASLLTDPLYQPFHGRDHTSS